MALLHLIQNKYFNCILKCKRPEIENSAAYVCNTIPPGNMYCLYKAIRQIIFQSEQKIKFPLAKIKRCQIFTKFNSFSF